MKLVRALAHSLGGRASLEAIPGPVGCESSVGARFELVFPAILPEPAATGPAKGYASPM